MRAALGFLTRLAVPAEQSRAEPANFLERLGREAPLFPVVGLIVGAVTAGVDAAAGLLFGPLVRSAAAVITGVAVTGALHLDGLMDTADGILSHRSRERMLEIMRDSRVGVMGVAAGGLALLLRFALLAETAPGLRWRALLVAPVLGRMAMALAAGLWPAARRPGDGLGSDFSAHVGRRRAAMAALLGLLLTALVCGLPGPTAGGWSGGLSGGGWAGLVAGGLHGLAAWGLACLATLLTGRAIAARLGGLTGDTYGAMNEAAELAALLLFAGACYNGT